MAATKNVYVEGVMEEWCGDDYSWRVFLHQGENGKVGMRTSIWDDFQCVANRCEGSIKITAEQNKSWINIRNGPRMAVNCFSDEFMPFHKLIVSQQHAAFLRSIFCGTEEVTLSNGLKDERGIDVAKVVTQPACFSRVLLCDSSGLREMFTVLVWEGSTKFVCNEGVSARLEPLVSTNDLTIDLSLMKFEAPDDDASWDLILPWWFWRKLLESEEQKMSLSSHDAFSHLGNNDCIICLSSLYTRCAAADKSFI